jgi:hypothetical protein
MAKKKEIRSFDDVLTFVRERKFDVLEAPGTSGRVFLKKNNCSAAIERDPDGGARVFAKPGYLIGGEISKLVDKGYQKFLKTSKTEVPATADHLRALHEFSEELREALGRISLYNESLGTVSDAYVYDRVDGREPGEDRGPRPWQPQEEKAQKAAGRKKPA